MRALFPNRARSQLARQSRCGSGIPEQPGDVLPIPQHRPALAKPDPAPGDHVQVQRVELREASWARIMSP